MLLAAFKWSGSMITKKVCLLGGVCVGKTSLARRYVYSSFADVYQSTIGVKIHKKSLQLDDVDVKLMVWDIQGEDRHDKVLISYLKGLSGYLLVVDLTQPESVDVATVLRDRVNSNFGNIPYVLVYSKCDLPEDPETRKRASNIETDAVNSIETSSLTGEGVDSAFVSLAHSLFSAQNTG